MIEIRDTAARCAGLPRVPPAPPNGTFNPPSSSDAAYAEYCIAEFRRAARRRWRPRVSARAKAHDLVYVDCRRALLGDCLRPMLKGREQLWFDPAMPAADGDIVLCRVNDALLHRFAAKADEKTLSKYVRKGTLPNTALKLLKTGSGRYWLCERTGALPLELEGEIIGTCVRIERPMPFIVRFAAVLGAVCLVWVLIYVVAAVLMGASG